MTPLIAFAHLSLLTHQDPAHAMVEQAMSVLGGRKKLESIRQITTTVAGHDYQVEQSERPTPPYLHSYVRGTRTYDFDQLFDSAELSYSGLIYGPSEFKRTFKIEKGASRAAAPLDVYTSYRRVALGPERALLQAAAATDLNAGKPIIFNGIPHNVVQFKWGTVSVRIFLKRGTLSPSAIETTAPLPFPFSIWGDVPMITRWGNWQALENGIMSPGQFSTEVNGYPISDVTVLSAKLTLAPGKAILPQPTALPKDDSAAMLARYKTVKVLDGIIQYQGPFNTFVVEQPDGLVVIEPVINPGFATAFLDRLAKDFPGKRVKAVIATDDAWPHFGGIRTFAARGAELVVLDLNRPIAQRFCDATFLTQPDELAQHPAKPKFKLVSKATTIGSGPNQMVLYPIAGQGSERMMMAFFPSHRLLYGSDLLQKVGNGFFFPSYPKELAEAVSREKLHVETVFAEHLGPTPWKTVTDFVAKTVGGS
jgi:Metallo-beta-lactamase superfamily